MLPEENEEPTTSDPGHLRKIVAEEVERQMNVLRGKRQVEVIETVPQDINPAFNIEVVREVVKEEIEKRLTVGTRNDVVGERSLHLKFLDEVSGPVQTSKEFRAVKDGPMKVALLDASGNIVNSGPESSAEVEILLIDASGKECAMTNENFERRIIRAGDKGKPHFAKNAFVNLDNGVGSLTNQKLGQDSGWTKNWTCRLGARLVGNFRGLKVQKAWTAPFKVIDNRGELYKTYEVPSPDSDVWRVKAIGRKGEPCKRLEAKLIMTVLDLLFWLSVNPKELQKKIIKAGDTRWKTIVDHARTCKINDKMVYCHKSSTEPHMGVIYDSVGELKGLIDESHFVPIHNLSADEKDHAHKLLSLVLEPSAFVERYKIVFQDEASLLQQYPYKSSNVNSSASCSMQQHPNGIASDINGFQTTELSCPSQSISPNNIFESLASRELCNHTSVPTSGPENILTYPDYEINGTQPCMLESNDMNAFQPNGGCQDSYRFSWSDAERLLLPPSPEICFSDDKSHIEMSNADDQRAAAAAVSKDNDMNIFQLWRFLYPTSPVLCVVDDYSHIEMSNADDQRAAAAAAVSTGNTSKGWVVLIFILRWKVSISRRVSGHPKRKKQRVAV